MPWRRRTPLKYPRLAALLLVLVTATGGGLAWLRWEKVRDANSGVEPLVQSGRVIDSAKVLNAEQVKALETYLRNFEMRSRHQIIVVTLTSLTEQRSISYARDLDNAPNTLSGRRDGRVILIVSPAEEAVRISVGSRLEPVLTRPYCAQVVALMTPSLRQKRFYEGIMVGVTGLARVARRI